MATAETYSRDDRVDVEEIMQKLYELFGNVFEFHVISSVAQKCNYNIELTSNELLEQLEQPSNYKEYGVINRLADPRFSNASNCVNASQVDHKKVDGASRFSYSHVAGFKQNNDDDDVIIESETISYNTSPGNSHLHPFNNISVRSKTLSKKEREFERIVQHVRQGAKILILLRGLPGSGKSYLARQIVDRTVGYKDYSIFILSTDDYFFNKRTRKYNYDPYKLQEAHEFNQQRAYRQMSTGVSPVIIDNTNTQMWEMKSYAMIGANFGYVIEILEPFTPWVFDEKQLTAKNSHGVPKNKIRDMLLRYEKHITPTSLFDTYKLSYLNQIPPVLRDFPPVQHTLPKLDHSNEKHLTDVHKPLTSNIVDLIGFDEKSDSSSSIYVIDDSCDENSRVKITNCNHSNLMDSILVDSNVNNDEILQPSIHNLQDPSNINLNFQPQINKMSISFNESVESKLDNDGMSTDKIAQRIRNAKDIYPSLNLASWGLPDNAISSWEFWDVVTPLNDSKNTAISLEADHDLETRKVVETSNCSTNTTSKDFALLHKKGVISSEQVKVLNTFSRDINEDVVIIPASSPSKKVLFHKSSMTDEDISYSLENNENEADQLDHLKTLFPDIPFDYVKEIYDKCKKNINWAVDLLLDDSKELPLLNGKIVNSSPKKTVPYQSDREINVKLSDTGTSTLISRSTSSNSAEIERHVKESIHINKDLYSDHITKIKNSRQKTGYAAKKMELPLWPDTSSFDVTPTKAGQVIAINSNLDMNEFEPEINFPNEDVDEDQTVEINLGNVCVSQLESLFGFPETFPKGFQPVVQIPFELAGQLHAFYIQSVLLQMETQNTILDMIEKEDEELAKKLQMQDDFFEDDDNGRRTPDLSEIMKEQVANKVYRKEIEGWKKLTPDTLAAKLTIQKLSNSFPSVSKSLLMEILHAHNNSYEQTVEVLLASTDQSSVYDPEENVREPPIPESVLIEMKQANEEKLATENIEDVSKSANEYRDEANDYHAKHNEYMQKAQQAFQSKQYAVALFYSDLAKSYTRLYEQSNGMAATAFLEEHSEKLQNFQTLDLHYLYVKEALPALDIFLDRNINLLKGTNKKKEILFIITGRGKRSQGKSRLRPAVINHLQKRDVKYSFLNPGLLKVIIHPYSILTHNLQQ